MTETAIESAEALGEVLKSARARQGLRQDDLAAMVGLSHVSLRHLEKGRATQVQTLFAVLRELGIVIRADVPGDACDP